MFCCDTTLTRWHNLWHYLYTGIFVSTAVLWKNSRKWLVSLKNVKLILLELCLPLHPLPSPPYPRPPQPQTLARMQIRSLNTSAASWTPSIISGGWALSDFLYYRCCLPGLCWLWSGSPAAAGGAPEEHDGCWTGAGSGAAHDKTPGHASAGWPWCLWPQGTLWRSAYVHMLHGSQTFLFHFPFTCISFYCLILSDCSAFNSS